MPDFVIELDRDAEVERAAARWRPPKWTVICAALLSVFTLTGAQPVPRPQLTQLGLFADPTAGLGFRALHDDLLIAEEPAGLAAYELDGRKRWRAYTDHYFAQDHPIRTLPGLIVVTGRAFDRGRSGDVVSALDTATGVERWRVNGKVDLVGDDRVVVRQENRTLQVYQVEPFRLRWQASDVYASAVHAQTRAVVAIASNGSIAEHDLDTGAARKLGQVTVPLGDGASIHVEDTLIVVRPWSPREPMEVPLESQFFSRKSLEPVDPQNLPSQLRLNCGLVICSYPLGEGRMSILDRESGDLLWRSRPGQVGVPMGGSLLIYEGEGLAQALTEPRTGAVRVDLAGWRILPTRGPDMPPLVIHSGPDSRIRLGVLESHWVRVVGVLPMEVTRCVYRLPLLACSVPHQLIGVWRIAL